MSLKFKKLQSLLIALLFVALGSKICLSEPTPFIGSINSDNINLRSDSTVTSERICTLNKGDRIEVILELYNWYKIRLPYFAPLYISKSLVECATNDKNCKKLKVIKSKVNLRLKPNETSPILGQVDIDQLLDMVNEDGDWYRIQPVTNSFGWVHKKFVDRAATKDISVKPSKMDMPIEINKEEAQEKKEITREGVLLPKVIRTIASHKLITDEKAIFLITGDSDKLKEFNRKRVKVTAYELESTTQSLPLLEIITVEEAP